jgi:hypothetical protein
MKEVERQLMGEAVNVEKARLDLGDARGKMHRLIQENLPALAERGIVRIQLNSSMLRGAREHAMGERNRR